MGLVSIYINISTIEDESITDTVTSAMFWASNTEDVHVGIAATVGEEFYENFIEPFTDYSNIDAIRLDPDRYRGCGRGRVESRFAYNNEDYILQVDAHTHFQPRWDETLTMLLSSAIKVTGSPKTLLSAYLGKYKNVDYLPVVMGAWPGYSVWSTNDINSSVPMKGVAPHKMADFPKEILEDSQQLFYPAFRICGHFIFGNKEWADFDGWGWDGNEMFWDEEVLPAIRLLEGGFCLVHPNIELPLTHLYRPEDGKRQVMDDLFDNIDEVYALTRSGISKFINENPEACERYHRYSGYNLVTNELTYDTFSLPTTFGYKENT